MIAVKSLGLVQVSQTGTPSNTLYPNRSSAFQPSGESSGPAKNNAPDSRPEL